MVKPKKRGSRGADWERLKVGWRIRWKSKRLHDRLSEDDRKRVKLTIMLDKLEGIESPLGTVRQLWWDNPDAENYIPKGFEKKLSKDNPITDPELISEHLPSLNRGNFSRNIILYELAKLGGRYEAQPAMVRKKAKKRKPRRKGKKLAGIREKRHEPRKRRKVRRHGGVSRR